jgi:hypothetical protein
LFNSSTGFSRMVLEAFLLQYIEAGNMTSQQPVHTRKQRCLAVARHTFSEPEGSMNPGIVPTPERCCCCQLLIRDRRVPEFMDTM